MILRAKRRQLAAIIVLVLALTACGGSSDGTSAAQLPDRAPSATQSTVVAETGAKSLPARWWAWVEASPPARNPVDDSTGAECAADQPSDVWFLAGTHGGSATRVCTIPLGRPIYVPVINQICTVPQSETVTQALNSCTGAADSATASLDGHLVRPIEATSQTGFTFTARPSSSTGFTSGSHQAVAWGLWVGPLSLTAGHHILTFAGTSGSFITKVTYRLSVTSAGGAA